MELTLEELTLYFYIACGVAAGFFLLTFILFCVLCVKMKRCAKDESNQLERQTNMMADFCYTNPTIVPGEELYRRGFSMYSGSDNFGEDFGMRNKDVHYGTCHEARSKF